MAPRERAPEEPSTRIRELGGVLHLRTNTTARPRLTGVGPGGSIDLRWRSRSGRDESLRSSLASVAGQVLGRPVFWVSGGFLEAF